MSESRPLLLPTASFVLGILGGEFFQPPVEAWVGLVMLGLLVAAVPGRRAREGFLVVFLGAGGLDHSVLRLPWDPLELRWRLVGQTVLGSVRGTLLEAPSIRLLERHGVLAERTLVRMEATAVRVSGGGWEPASGDLMVSTEGVPGEGFHRGAAVELDGVLSAPPGPRMRGLLDYGRFLEFQGVGVVLRCESPADWHIQPGPGTDPPWDERFLRWARRRLSEGLPDDEAARLVWAMVLGWKTALSGEVDDAFMRSGTLHLFAISGLHVALVAVALVQGLRLLRFSRASCGLLALPLSWFYVAATGWQASAVRSAVMCSVVVGTWSLARPADLLNSLALSALLLLAWDPGQLFQAGFLLSFGVVGAMPLLVPVFEGFLQRIRPWKPDPLLPERLWSPGRRIMESCLRWLLPALANGLAALASSVPFTAHFFHLVSLVAVPVNLAAVPLGTLILVSGLLSLVIPVGTTVWNAAAWLAMRSLVGLARAGAEVPYGWFRVETPPPWVWSPYVLWFAIPVLGARLRGRFRTAWIALAAVLSAGAAGSVWAAGRVPRIAVFPKGEAILVEEGRQGVDWLLDAGDEVGARRLVLPTLESRGIVHLEAVALSRFDTRHAAGFPVLAEAIKPTRWLRVRSGRSVPLMEAESAARRHGVEARLLSAGDRWSAWTVLHPGADARFSRGDDGALAFAGELAGWRVLLAPALGTEGQADLVRRMGSRLRADLLVTGNPRTGEAAGTELLAAVQPRVVIVTGSRGPALGKTPTAVRRRLREMPARVFYTEETGGLDLEFGDRLEVRDARGELLGDWDRDPLREPRPPDRTSSP